MITADQLKDIQERTEALHRYLGIDQKRIEFEEEQLRTQAPDFWDDPKRAQEQMKKVKDIEKWIKGYDEARALTDEVQLAFDFYKDELVTEEEVDAAMIRLKEGRRLRTQEHAPPRRGSNGVCYEDKLRCWRYRKPRLGIYAHAYVHAMGRVSRL